MYKLVGMVETLGPLWDLLKLAGRTIQLHFSELFETNPAYAEVLTNWLKKKIIKVGFKNLFIQILVFYWQENWQPGWSQNSSVDGIKSFEGQWVM